MKRSSLKRRPMKRKAMIPTNVRRAVYRAQGWRCLICGTVQAHHPIHHVLPQSKWPEYALEPRNLVALCWGCHDAHERAHRRIRWDELPEQTRTWIHGLGGLEMLYAERVYRV